MTSLKFAAISVLLLCFSPNVFAQHIDDIQSVTVLKDKNSVNITPVDISRCDILDTALLTVAYRMYARASEGSEPKYIDDIILLIGRRYTQSFPGMYDRIDSLFSVKKLSLGAPMVTDMEVLRDIQSDSISVYNRLPAMGDLSLSYSECLPRFDWRITQQTEEICGYPCYTATTNFRGREWRVLFAPELPFNFGPYKFSGLPGLILCAETADGDYSFTCASISTKDTRPIVFRYPNSKTMGRGKVRDKIASFCQAPLTYIGGTPHKLNIFYAGNKRLDNFWSIDYNPIELE